MTEEPPITAEQLQEKFGKVDFEKLIRDELLKENKDYCDKLQAEVFYKNFKDWVNTTYEQDESGQSYIIVHPEAYRVIKDVLDDSFFGKLKLGWRRFALSVSDWQDAMVCEDYVDEFFEYLGCCDDT